MLNRERLLSTFVELCRIPSPSRNESRVADYIKHRVQSLGFSIVEDNAGMILGGNANNIIVHLDGDTSKEPVFIVSHMDTVPVPDVEELRVVVEGGIFKTDGTHPLGADDKAGVAIELELLRVFSENKDEKTNRPVDFVFTVQEEVGTRGASVLDTRLINARMGFVLDSEFDVGSAIYQSSYKRQFKVAAYGKSSHAAVAPERGINAIKALGEVIVELPSGRWKNESVINLGVISGGSSTNVVPSYAELVGEVRSFSGEELGRLMRAMEEKVFAVEKHSSIPGIRIEIVWENLYDGYRVDEHSPISVIFKSACKKTGYKPLFVRSLGGSDANHLNRKGLECIVLGLGMKNIHSNDEYITAESIIDAYRLLYAVVALGE